MDHWWSASCTIALGTNGFGYTRARAGEFWIGLKRYVAHLPNPGVPRVGLELVGSLLNIAK